MWWLMRPAALHVHASFVVVVARCPLDLDPLDSQQISPLVAFWTARHIVLTCPQPFSCSSRPGSFSQRSTDRTRSVQPTWASNAGEAGD